MKKTFIGILLVSLIFIFIFFISNLFNVEDAEQSNVVANVTHLGKQSTDNGEVILFALENQGNNVVTLQFPSFGEYSFTLDYLSNQDIPSGTINFGHPTLDMYASPDGRSVILSPGEKLEYQILLYNLVSGKYEIEILSSSNHGGIVKEEFEVN